MKKTILLLLFGLALLNGCMHLQQPSMTFFPYATLDQTPAEWGVAYEDVFLDTADDVRLHGWYIPRHDSRQVLLFFHGNAGNISHRGASVEIFHQLGLNVFIFDYRGYGKSQGKPDENGLYEDARAAWRYLTNERKFDQKDIILFGRSLGGAVAAELAAEVQPGGLILESTFSSAREVANVIFPVLSRLIVLRYDFNTAAHMRQITSPVLVLHSPDDEIIPLRLGEQVFQAANEPKSFVKMRGGHNNGFLMSQPDYERALGAFISSVNGR
ncbi:MAG TPA: alpha/beta hydrolase [Gammaproteobacteria bacterium]|nr:alpha/beta hydrolase [Gammaproteobacteria bacterium]